MSETENPKGPPTGESETTGASAASGDATGQSEAPDWQAAFEDQRDKYLRLAADHENFRKRAIKERTEAGTRAQGELIGGLVEILDDISRFAQVDPATTDVRTVVDGVGMVEKKAMKALAAQGLEIVHPVDQPFDPALHEAVGTEQAETADRDHLVARVYQSGYLFRGQLLRPARVVVRQWNG